MIKYELSSLQEKHRIMGRANFSAWNNSSDAYPTTFVMIIVPVSISDNRKLLFRRYIIMHISPLTPVNALDRLLDIVTGPFSDSLLLISQNPKPECYLVHIQRQLDP